MQPRPATEVDDSASPLPAPAPTPSRASASDPADGDHGTSAYEVELATPWQRLAAAAIDVAITAVCAIVAGLWVVGIIVAANDGFEPDDAGGVVALLLSIGGIALLLVAYPLIALVLVATRGQTVGKMAVNIQIIHTDGRAIGWTGMLLREVVGKWLPSFVTIVAVIWILSYFWILIDAKRQGWHDKIGDTYVVRLSSS